MAMNGTLTDKGTTTKTKKLNGATLADVEKESQRSGMVDPNDRSKRFFSVTDVTIKIKIGNDAWYPGGMSIMRFLVHVHPQLLNPEVIVSSEITMCVPKDLKRMSPAAQTEWKRFYKKLETHEKQHVADGKKLAAEILKEVAAISVHLKTESVNEIQIRKEALFMLEKEVTAKFGGGEIEKRINAVMKKLDGGGHGGVILKTSIT